MDYLPKIRVEFLGDGTYKVITINRCRPLKVGIH